MRRSRSFVPALAVLVLVFQGGCSLVTRPVPPRTPGTLPAHQPPEDPLDEPEGGWIEEGVASWYGSPFHGRQTASGERYDMEAPTAAHPSLPFGTVVEVHNLDNDRRTHLRINDRGPFVDGRVIDVSRHGARELGMLGSGIARVRIAIVEAPAEERCWEVQAGTFASSDNAEGLRHRLVDQGHEARIVAAPRGLHRVMVGPFEFLEEAVDVADRTGGLTLRCGRAGDAGVAGV